MKCLWQLGCLGAGWWEHLLEDILLLSSLRAFVPWQLPASFSPLTTTWWMGPALPSAPTTLATRQRTCRPSVASHVTSCPAWSWSSGVYAPLWPRCRTVSAKWSVASTPRLLAGAPACVSPVMLRLDEVRLDANNLSPAFRPKRTKSWPTSWGGPHSATTTGSSTGRETSGRWTAAPSVAARWGSRQTGTDWRHSLKKDPGGCGGSFHVPWPDTQVVSFS